MNNITWHHMGVDKNLRSKRNNQRPIIIWFTGLSGAGKSTIANSLEALLFSQGYHTYLLDGDNVRHGLCADLGFSDTDRSENIRRVGEAAKLMLDAGLIVLACFISPRRQDREQVKSLVGADEFFEVYVNASLNVCESRDPKGLYKKARAGVIKQFSGISSVYEAPENPNIVVDSEALSVKQCVDLIVNGLLQSGALQWSAREPSSHINPSEILMC